MKFSIDRAALLRPVNHTQSVVEKRNTVPILSNVLMRAEDGILAIAATDMDLEMSEAVAAQVDQPGATTVPAHMLHDIVRKMPDDASVNFMLEPDGHSMTVTSGRSRFKLSCLPVADFPEIGTGELPNEFMIAASELRTLIDRTKFAMSTEETRYYLNGIYLHAVEVEGVQLLRAVATDGHRLSRYEMPCPAGAEGMPGIIIPRKAILEIRKLIDEAADSIKINISESKIRFSFDHIVMTSKLIDGTFPDYDRVIPKGNDKIVEIDPKAFTSAIDRVSTISDGKTRAVKITMNGKMMTLSASTPEAGSATEEVEIISDANLEIGFNARYLLDITTQINSDKGEGGEGGCQMLLSDSASPTIIQDNKDRSALYVLMPLRV